MMKMPLLGLLQVCLVFKVTYGFTSRSTCSSSGGSSSSSSTRNEFTRTRFCNNVDSNAKPSTTTLTSTPPPDTSLMRTWDARYSMEGFAYGTEPNTFLKETVQSLLLVDPSLPSNAACLMLAEGEGRNAVFMAQQGFHATGVDSSAVGMHKAQGLAEQHQVDITTRVADLQEFDLGVEEWDVIAGIYCHVPSKIRQRILADIPRALKPGGYAIFECYTPLQPQFHSGGPHSADLFYTREMFHQAFHDKLHVVRNTELIRNVREGRYHTGDGAVVQFIGQKAR